MAEEKTTAGAAPFHCPMCLATTSGRYAFCPECGEPLDVQCPNCGLAWRFYIKHTFCPSCGERVPQKARLATPKGWG